MDTRLLKEAAAAGCDTIGGLDMLVAQAEDQSEWWLGIRPPAGLIGRPLNRRSQSPRAGRAAMKQTSSKRSSNLRNEARSCRCEGSGGGLADTGLGVSADCRALGLRVSAGKRRGWRARRTVFVPGQGSVRDAPRRATARPSSKRPVSPPRGPSRSSMCCGG